MTDHVNINRSRGKQEDYKLSFSSFDFEELMGHPGRKDQ